MSARVAAGILLSIGQLTVYSGCERPEANFVAANQSQAAAWRYSSTVVLGSAELTAGIPGEGPLTPAEIRSWLSQDSVHEPLDIRLPIGLADAASLIHIPPDNRLTRAKIELGRQLFFDPRLSKVGSTACSMCHLPEQDYSIHGVIPESRRNPPVCFNRIFSTRQSWDGRDESLEHQVAGPVTGLVELGTTPQDCANRLRAIEGYRMQFDAIFGELHFDAIAAALASFQRVLVTGPSPWDYRRLLAEYGNVDPKSLPTEERQFVQTLRNGARTNPMSDAAIRGAALFFSDRTRCHTCHSGPNLTDEAYHNVGAGMELHNPDLGRYVITGRKADFGAFKTPTLRNVARTSPYMHNGQFGTLREVVEWFDQGGYRHASLDREIRPLDLTRDEKRDLVAFLETLTGPLPTVETGRLPE
jgi:cytochrome c peroxidase